MPSDTERKVVGKIWFQGSTLVSIVSMAVIYGRLYYDIKCPDGTIKTVPADLCTKEQTNK